MHALAHTVHIARPNTPLYAYDAYAHTHTRALALASIHPTRPSPHLTSPALSPAPTQTWFVDPASHGIPRPAIVAIAHDASYAPR